MYSISFCQVVKVINSEEFTSGRIFASEAKPTTAQAIARRPTSRVGSIKSNMKASIAAQPPKPRYDPTEENAVILYDAIGPKNDKGELHCSVVVDPYIGKYVY